MVGVEPIFECFPDFSVSQRDQLSQLKNAYLDWNKKVNVISRKDTHDFWIRHVLHSLIIARFISFKPGTRVLDLGTGGGFPGIPLAIMFPEVHFTLIDGTRKKIKVVNDIIDQLQLKNAIGVHRRVEEEKNKYDFIVTRAVAKMKRLLDWSIPICNTVHVNAIPNGIIALKGGDLKEELKEIPKSYGIDKRPLLDYFENELFEGKYLIYIAI